jgi:tetratricopeptide (TPR) repeat protein
LGAAFLVAVAGCRWWRDEGPVSPSLAACRQLSQQAVEALECGDGDGAWKLSQRAVDACPTDATARRQLAEALWRRRQATDAVAQLEAARRLAPHDAALTIRAGEMYLDGGQTALAQQRANEAIDQAPTSAAAWALRGRTRHAAGQLDDALADYLRALGHQPDSPDVMQRAAQVYLQKGSPDRALPLAQAAVESYGAGEEPIEALALLGSIMTRLGRPDEAAECFARAERRHSHVARRQPPFPPQ